MATWINICSECGNELQRRYKDNGVVEVTPCAKCLKVQYDIGYKHGKEDGLEEKEAV